MRLGRLPEDIEIFNVFPVLKPSKISLLNRKLRVKS